MRASALIADESFDRIEARERIESALELERALMNGTPSTPGLAIAGWIEEGVRRILRETALGELSSDLNTAADETLIASGLGAGDTEIAVAEEIAEPAEIVVPDEIPAAEEIAVSREVPRVQEATAQDFEPPEEEYEMNQETRILEPIPDEGEIRITATPWLEEVDAPEHSTLDFPAIEGDVQHRERIDTPRVRHLFPVPDDADWEVRELKYDHYRAG